ncbi:MAG: metal-dependent hydrolase [Patescibacteria group bacterium]
MASFRGHIGFGLLVAVFVTGAFVINSIVTGFAVPSALFLAIVIGSFMPDLDSDASIVFSIIYSLFTSIVLGIVVYWVYLQYGWDAKQLVIAVSVSFVVVWFVLRLIFMKLTKHRGMFHSIPAALIAGLVGFQSVMYFSGDMNLALWFGIGFALGYVAHLVLDELYAGINFNGTPFRSNKMLGTALKLYSGSKWANVTTYVILLVLLYKTYLVW